MLRGPNRDAAAEVVASFVDHREAIAKARQIIEEYAAGLVTPGIKASALYATYIESGPRPTVETNGLKGRVIADSFDPLDYAQEVCAMRAEQARKPEVGQLVPVASDDVVAATKKPVALDSISLVLPATDLYRVLVRDLSTGSAQTVASLPSYKAALLIANQVIADYVDSLLASGVQAAELYTKYAEVGPRPTIESDGADGQVSASPLDALAIARKECDQKIAETTPQEAGQRLQPGGGVAGHAPAAGPAVTPQQVEVKPVARAPESPPQKVYRVMVGGRGPDSSPQVDATFPDREQAIVRAKHVIEAYVGGLVTPTMKASELYARFLQLGPKLSIESDGPGARVIA